MAFLHFLKGSLRVSKRHLAPQRRRRFVSGDVRADEIPGLLGLHTVFVREHNRVAKFFRDSYPGWSDDDVFQYARWINIAQFQNVVYREYLPVLLGRRAMEEYRLVSR